MCLLTNFVAAQTLPNPILFCSQIPNPFGFASSMETFGNHHASMYAAPRGGDLYIRYPNGNLKNLTQTAGFGQTGMQGATSIAVRDPHVHWDGQKALFSMAVGAPTQQYQVLTFYWQIYEITGLGENETPVVTLVPNQPTNYNNIQPIYGTDDRIIFTSDRPRGGWAHLYPQHDEYESSAVTTGIWRLDPGACSMADGLEMLSHSPSGDFNPIIDDFGRVVFTRWDHLQRDQQADADIMNSNGGYSYGTFNYANENSNAAKLPIQPENEVFPEPRGSRIDLLSLPAWANTNGQTINIFNPWMMNENGTELEILNHLGRHEMDTYMDANFTNDPNLDYYGGYLAPDDTPIRAIFQIQESPVTPGLYFGTEAGEFGSHASGMVVSVLAPEGTHPEDVEFTYITHPSTRSPDDTPPPTHTGLYRNPLPLTNGQVLVMHTAETDYDENIGNDQNPQSAYDYRLKLLVPDGNYFKASPTAITGAGISKSVSWWSPDVLRNYNGLLWETYPVEVRVRERPAEPTLNIENVPEIEQNLFDSAQVDLTKFRKFLRRNNLALLVTRDVTSRDDADFQQPFNLKVQNTTHQTVDPDNPTPLYEVKYLQYLQADQVRGIGGIPNPRPGRRPIAQWLHDSLSVVYNPASSGGPGSQNIHSDGSVAAIVPANRALAWQLTDINNKGIVRERLWVSAVPGEVRVCTSCHGESTLNQANLTSPQNPPLALTSILNHVKAFDRDNDGVNDIDDAHPHDPTRHIAEPLSETFVATLSNWLNENPDSDNAFWVLKTAIPCGDAKSVSISNRSTPQTGRSDRLRRFVDLKDLDFAKLSFDVAYARYSPTRFDRLRVKAVCCDGTEEIVYDKSSSDLATAPDQTAIFTPTGCGQWRTECINLTKYAGKTVEIVFEVIGGYGNRLFLDNIKLNETDTGVPLAVLTGEQNPCANAEEIYTLTSTYPPGTPLVWSVEGGSIVAGQGTANLTVAWGAGSEGSVSLRVGQTCLATTTRRVKLKPAPAASIAADPAHGLPTCADGIVLTATANPNWTFQWFKNGVELAGETSATLETDETGVFKVEVSAAGSDCVANPEFEVFPNFACNPNFCASSGATSQEWIQSVKIGGTTNASGNNGGYSNFVDVLDPIVLPRGLAQTFEFVPGFAGAAFTERWRVWVDFNKDGDFLDAGETLFSISGTGNLSKNYTIPATRPTGATRMRVAMRRGSYATSCLNFASGEVEDYVVIIETADPGGAPKPAAVARTAGEILEKNQLKIFPNPASEVVTLTFPPVEVADELLIFNALGQQVGQVSRSAGESERRLDVSRWAAGLYFLKIGEEIVGRFAVQR